MPGCALMAAGVLCAEVLRRSVGVPRMIVVARDARSARIEVTHPPELATRFGVIRSGEAHSMSERQFWIGVVSKDHVDRATAGGFAQVNHGKAGPLERMHAGDGFAFYSPRTSYPDGAPLQAFTAIGRVRSGTVYQAEMDDGFRPFRLDVDFLRRRAGPGQAAAARAFVHPQQDALGRCVPFRRRARPGSRFRGDRRGDEAFVRRRLSG